jgi:RNA polymerase sigma factor (sigma-70 family)
MYRRHVGDVYRYALAVMRNPADAEDVTQTTFLNAYRAYTEKGNRPEKPQNWLIAIAHNVCRQRFRQSSRRPNEVTFEDDIADTLVDEDALTGDDIRRALGHLAFNQRAALVMRELEGRSYAEIAEILELSTSAVETLIFRARRALREQLEGTLTCGEAEFAISRQLDGRLPRRERGQLRAHLRECAECAGFARRQRAQRGALKTLALVPVPSSLTSLFGGGGATIGAGIAIKAAAAVTAGVVIGGAGYEGVQHAPWRDSQRVAAAPRIQPVVGTHLTKRSAGLSLTKTSRAHSNAWRRGQVTGTQKNSGNGRASGHGKATTTHAAAARITSPRRNSAHTPHATAPAHPHARPAKKAAPKATPRRKPPSPPAAKQPKQKP